MHYPRTSILFWLCATFAIATPAAADDMRSSTTVLQTQPTTQNPNETTTAAKSNYQKRQVCQAHQVTGTRIAKTVCMTEAERDARRKNDQDWKNSYDLMRDRQPPPGGGVKGG
jgi:hypothetical protein